MTTNEFGFFWQQSKILIPNELNRFIKLSFHELFLIYKTQVQEIIFAFALLKSILLNTFSS